MLGIGILLCLVCGTIAVFTGSVWAAFGCCVGLVIVVNRDHKAKGGE
jgi:hypothetical protein